MKRNKQKINNFIVQVAYVDTLKHIRKISKNLKADDCLEYHDCLKKWFNKLI